MVIVVYDPGDEYVVRTVIEVAAKHGVAVRDELVRILGQKQELANYPEELVQSLPKKYRAKLARYTAVEVEH